MGNNVKIKSLEIYHPETKVSNEHYLNHFEKQGKDITRLLEAFGRNERYIANKDENTVTMGAQAAIKALDEANLTGADIDIILFSSSVPEYTAPTQALIIHNAIKGKEEALVMDTNVNCVGMVATMDMAIRYLENNPSFKRALIVGAENMSAHSKNTDEMTYAQFGDMACALILEKTEEDSYLLGTKYVTNSDNCNIVQYPHCGTSNSYDVNSCDERKLNWTPFDGSFVVDVAKGALDELLSLNGLKMNDISLFGITQYAKSITDGCVQVFDVEAEKIPYIGDKYGYTGTTSPFVALHSAMKENKIKRGDYIALWSVGTNWTTCSMVLKY